MTDNRAHLEQIKKEEKNNLAPTVKSGATLRMFHPPRNAHQDNQPINTKQEAVKNNVSDRPAAQKEINWQSYPYNSSNENKLQERASKVKEIIFNCGTSNELIKLENEGKISEREITWLKKNVLTTAEREQVMEIESTRQGNLFSIDANQQVVHYEFNDVMREIDEEMRRLNWSKGQGKDYLIKTYGVKSRLKLKDRQLVEFLKYLERQ